MSPLQTTLSALRSTARISQRRSCSSSCSQFRSNQLYTRPQHKPQPRYPPFSFSTLKYHSTTTSTPSTSRPLTDRISPAQSHKPHAPKPPTPERPEYEMTFTCTPCSTRSTHRISKQGYHKGSVLVTCPDCKNRHVISDHLNIFGDKKFTIEDVMRDQGQLVKKGTLSEDGDFEFWADGTTTPRAKSESDSGSKKTDEYEPRT
ncbi:hypothetical protein WAI453_012138 [Rhynchosporium graminicola]